ncbi:hypothetical protein BHM03_00015955 [Ensete ventricosum]|nr:hypothetical protein BHM03_00015955 [Ensete ventricosum]
MLLFRIMSTSCWNSNVAGERVQKDHSGGAGDPLSVLLSRGKLVPDVYNTAVGRAFIVSAIGHSYLVSLLPLLLTIPLYLSTTPVVLARELENCVDRAVARELNGTGADPTEQELGS